MLFEEGGERFGRHAVELELVERLGKIGILLQRHENAAHLGILAMFDQALLQLGGLHALCRIERGSE